MARLKAAPGTKVPRKNASSVNYGIEPGDSQSDESSTSSKGSSEEADEEGDDDDEEEEEESDENDSGLVEHLGSDLPEAATSAALSWYSDVLRCRESSMLSSPDGPTRQLLQEAAARSPDVIRSSMNRTPTGMTPSDERAHGSQRLESASLPARSESSNPSHQPQASTGDPRRPFEHSMQAFRLNLKREANQVAQNSAVKRVKQTNPETDVNPLQQRSSLAFRDEDWDVPDTDDRRPKTGSAGHGQRLATIRQQQDTPSRSGRRSVPPRGAKGNVALANEELAQKKSPRRKQRLRKEQVVSSVEDEEEPLDEIQVRPRTRQSVAQQKASSQKDTTPATSQRQRPMTSKQARAATVRQKYRPRQQLRARQESNREDEEEKDDEEEDDDHVPAVAEAPNQKQRERRRGTMDVEQQHHAKSNPTDAEDNVHMQRRQSRHQEQQDDDSVNDLFVKDYKQPAGTNDSSEDEDVDADKRLGPEDNSRFVGQFQSLREMLKVINKRTYSRKPTVKEIKKFHRLCNTVCDLFDDLADAQDDNETRRCESDLAENVRVMQRMADGMNADESDHGQLYAQDVYRSAFPGLTRVFIAHCLFFESNGGLDADALQDLQNLAATIFKLRNRSQSWRTKPDTSAAIVRPIVNDVVAPLKRVCDAFKRQAIHLRRIEREDHEQRKAQERFRKQQEEYAIYEKRKAFESIMNRHLQELYLTRQEVEPDRKRRAHLGLPQKMYLHLGYNTDIDANGSQFERVRLFGSRTASSLSRPVELPQAAWTKKQRCDFHEGLAAFKDRTFMFSDIMRAYCTPKGSLRNFKVHDLLEEAVKLREDLLRNEERDPRHRTPDFIRNMAATDLLEHLFKRYI